MALRLIAASKTDVGKQREQNEDNLYSQIIEDDRHASGLFIVADGMGGYHAGEVASKIAVETVSDMLKAVLGPTSSQPTMPLNRTRGRDKGAKVTRKLPAVEGEGESKAASETSEAETVTLPAAQPTKALTESMALEHYSDLLRNAIEQSSEKIVEYGDEHKEARGLGSTITAALVVEGQAFIANVGDSRTYLLRDGKLTRVTSDHSLVERLVQAGQIDRDDVYDHPSRNLIYRSLGAGRAEVDVDIFTERLQPGDALLLCSDGLWEMVRDPQLTNILTEVDDLNETVNLLIQRANENGGEDNISAVLVRGVAG
ncbi:MAG TPA: PP2C family serine/threonine-protein phosphatase [Ktedonobacterales bacterium]|nr:PP2C family serine/threonine-protein phosphatase [Ktedonobacterales bacterium]